MVGEGGLEPPHPFEYWHLKPARLPIPPLARVANHKGPKDTAAVVISRHSGGWVGSTAVGLKGFERRLERLVEGTFARAFKSAIQPVELGRRLVREMDDQRSVNVEGAMVVPNVFTVTLSPEDYESLASLGTSLPRELAETARNHGRQQRYVSLGPIEVHLQADPGLRTGSFGLTARFVEAQRPEISATLILADGQRATLADTPVLIGRTSDANIQLTDTSVSRRHAEIRPDGAHYVLVDLGSTNGTRVNGAAISQQQLRNGDHILVGDYALRFEQS